MHAINKLTEWAGTGAAGRGGRRAGGAGNAGPGSREK